MQTCLQNFPVSLIPVTYKDYILAIIVSLAWKKNWCFLKIKSSCEKIIQVALLFKKKKSGTFDNYFDIIWKHNQLTRMFIIRF